MDNEYLVKSIRNKLDTISNDLFKLQEKKDMNIDLCLNRIDQEVMSIRHTLKNSNMEYNSQLKLIKEISINVSMFSLLINSMLEKISEDIKDKIYTTGYMNWNTKPHQVKFLNEISNKHFERIKKMEINIIDSLSLFYKDFIEYVDQENNTLKDNPEIIMQFKEFYKNQCYSCFIYNWEYFYDFMIQGFNEKIQINLKENNNKFLNLKSQTLL